MSRIIAVFGSARVQPDNPVYQDSYHVGKALADAGYVTMTGGYAGVMEAASKGAAEAGGEVQGITVESLEYIGESRANEWLTVEIQYATLPERVDHLVQTAEAYIVMPGGLGTTQELVEVWQGMRLGDLPRKPLLVYGDFWKPMIDGLLAGAYISDRDMQYIMYADSANDIIDKLSAWFEENSEE